MAEQPRPDDLAQLRAELVSLRAEVRRNRLPRRFLPLALVGLLVALLPLSILAAGPFGDLNPGRDAANADIQAIADAGITKGCNPPDFTAYCPNDLVTREQMASFLARTAGLGTNPPVVNAKTAQAAGSAITAENADNANTVGGYAPSGLVRVARVAIPQEAITGSLHSYGPPLTIQAPAAGFVLVTGSVLINGGSSCPCTPLIYLHHVQSGAISPDSGPTVEATSTDYANAAFSWVFQVAAGSNTFDLRAFSGSGNSSIYQGQLAALYVPFGSTGAGSVGTDQPTPEPSAPPTKP